MTAFDHQIIQSLSLLSDEAKEKAIEVLGGYKKPKKVAKSSIRDNEMKQQLIKSFNLKLSR